MSIIGGYQSDLNLEDVQFTGDLPATNTIGGFGITQGEANAYTLTLDPAISKYRSGLCLHVFFHITNTEPSTISVNGLNAVPIRKIRNSQSLKLEANDLDVAKIYTLLFDGERFQVDLAEAAPTVTLPNSSFTRRGIIRLAGFDTVNQGTNNSQAITPQGLAQNLDLRFDQAGFTRVAGIINASEPVAFPQAEQGDIYIVVVEGDAAGQVGQTTVNNHDLLFCVQDTEGGEGEEDANDWHIISANGSSLPPLPNATIDQQGIIQIATQQVVDQGVNDRRAVTPRTLRTVIDSLSFGGGFFTDKGNLDTADFPEFPSGERGDLYTILSDGIGYIGGYDGSDGLEVTNGNLLVCVQDNQGGDITMVGDSWMAIRNINLQEADEDNAGIVRAADLQTVLAAQSYTTFVAPRRLEQRLDRLVNRQEILTIETEHLGSSLTVLNDSNKYAVINGNLVVPQRIELSPNQQTPLELSGHVLNLPKPLNQDTVIHSVSTQLGRNLYLRMNAEGEVEIIGLVNDSSDNIVVDFNPYIAQTPIEYSDNSPS